MLNFERLPCRAVHTIAKEDSQGYCESCMCLDMLAIQGFRQKETIDQSWALQRGAIEIVRLVLTGDKFIVGMN